MDYFKYIPIDIIELIFKNFDQKTICRLSMVCKDFKYICDNKLQNTQAKTKINADEPLKKLLRLNQEELTYFNLQKYMNQHFV